MMACSWGTLRCARLGNFIYHRWHQQKCHQLLDSTLNRKEINAFQYIAFVKHLCTANDVKPAQKKVQRTPKIILYLENDKFIVTDVEAAQKLAKRRVLILTKVKDDYKGEKAVYKLVSKHELTGDLEEVTDDADDGCKKTEKVVWISGKIDQHDFEIKLKKIRTMLQKRFKCRVMKTCLATENVDKTTDQIRRAVNEFGEVTKVENKKSVLKICIVPLPKIIGSGNEY